MVLEVEERAYNAWPAAVTAELDGWRFRFNGGVTGRANSVWPNADGGKVPLEEKLTAAEAFYTGHGIPPAFQICPAACPESLDAILDARGYHPEDRTCVQVGELETVLSRSAVDPALEVSVGDAISEAWHAIYTGSEGAAGPGAALRREIIERIALPVGFATARLEGEPVAVGLGVLEAGWIGLFCIATRPEYRRRGAGAAAVSALARWAAESGAERAYLQVTVKNTAAQSLYERFGFRTLYTYYYRRKRNSK